MNMVSRRLHSSTPVTVLLADPDAEVRLAYCRTLQAAGCDVIESADGRDALVQALVRTPTLVITSLSLPFLDGYALCEILRRDRTTADTPILVVTDEKRPNELRRAARVGADIVLEKPASAASVLETVQALLAKSARLRESSHATRQKIAQQLERSAAVLERSADQRRRVLSKSVERFETDAPPLPPPDLRCPSCDGPLHYEHSHVGGVSDRHPEQWDYYECAANCGRFQYRQRTRKLRPLS